MPDQVARRMNRRAFVFAATAAACTAPAVAQARPYRAPRTVFGAPSLQGFWTNASYTDLERDKAFKTLTISPEEARKAEAVFARLGQFTTDDPDPLGQKDSEYWEVGSGLARVRGEIRTSFIVDPPDGKMPFTDEARKRFHIGDPNWHRGYDNPEERSVTERCVASEGGYPPNLPSPDGNYLQIVQTRDHVAMLSEKYHDAHVIRLGAQAHDPAAVTSWMGDAIGRWEGETLVVENTNFSSVAARSDGLKLSAASTIQEKFTRLSPDDLLYEFTIADPTLYTRPWRCEMPFRRTTARMFEYTCHEGNYGLTNILQGARRLEQQGGAKAAQ
ncbi:MAG TPA: hypothetical protein VGC92_16820 [Phenylobacterium sp.]|jgi:hypothetical protein